jgi:phenylacetyl-CoA:acceptor oxidoreductase subunit 1
MAIDLEKCSGCQTCTVACKVEHGLGPALQRNTTVEKEIGKYPAVKRIYISKRCMHCADPQCLSVCPTGATQQRADGIVIIDKKKCMGCRYCMMACPYNARVFCGARQSYHTQPSLWEAKRYRDLTVGTVDKCDFCESRIDAGLKKNLTPGIHPEATPFCVVSCIASALHFGDMDDEDSEVSRLIKSRNGVQLLPEMDTDPSVYYLPRRM